MELPTESGVERKGVKSKVGLWLVSPVLGFNSEGNKVSGK